MNPSVHCRRKVYLAESNGFLCLRKTLFITLVTTGTSASAVTIDLPANIELTAIAGVEVQYDDNVYLSAESPKSDFIARTSPSIELTREGQASTLSSGFTITRGNYQNGTRENFTDYNASMAWQWRANSLVEVGASASYADVSQSTNRSLDNGLAAILIEAERTRRPSGELSVLLGRQGGKLQGSIRQGIQKNAFEDPSRDSTSRYSIVSTTYSVNSQLALGIQLGDTELEYAEITASPSRDSNERLVLATAEYSLPKTRFRVRAGRLHKEFNPEVRPDFTGPRWDASISWSPKSYSTISLATGKNVQESSGIANFIDVRSNVFSWSHQWSGSLSSLLSHSDTVGEFAGTDRSDKVLRSSISVRYLPLDWLSVSLGMSSIDNRSSDEGRALENNRYFISLEAPL